MMVGCRALHDLCIGLVLAVSRHPLLNLDRIVGLLDELCAIVNDVGATSPPQSLGVVLFPENWDHGWDRCRVRSQRTIHCHTYVRIPVFLDDLLMHRLCREVAHARL